MKYQKPDELRNIQSSLKGKKTNYRDAMNPVVYAYEKLLREQAKSKKVYEDINPYAEVYQFRENIYGIYTYSLDGMGDPWIFVINGPEKALVIDTSFGLGNLRGLVEEIIGKNKEYFVANTHCHYDHAYGNYQFDRVYCHEYEEHMLQYYMNEHVWDYLFDENGKGIWADFPRKDMIPFRYYEVIGVPDGYIFHLGKGHDVELIHLPGHSPGHAGFLDKYNRILFVGDDCCFGNIGISAGLRPWMKHAEYCTVEAMANAFKRVLGRKDEYDTLYPSHGIVEMGTAMLENLLETCEEVLEDPSCYDEKIVHELHDHKAVTYRKMIFQNGCLVYGTKGLYMGKEIGEDL